MALVGCQLLANHLPQSVEDVDGDRDDQSQAEGRGAVGDVSARQGSNGAGGAPCVAASMVLHCVASRGQSDMEEPGKQALSVCVDRGVRVS